MDTVTEALVGLTTGLRVHTGEEADVFLLTVPVVLLIVAVVCQIQHRCFPVKGMR